MPALMADVVCAQSPMVSTPNTAAKRKIPVFERRMVLSQKDVGDFFAWSNKTFSDFEPSQLSSQRVVVERRRLAVVGGGFGSSRQQGFDVCNALSAFAAHTAHSSSHERERRNAFSTGYAETVFPARGEVSAFSKN